MSKANSKKNKFNCLFGAQNNSLLENLQKKVLPIAMDMVPDSRAQKMDALSSLSNNASYRAVVEATNNLIDFLAR